MPEPRLWKLAATAILLASLVGPAAAETTSEGLSGGSRTLSDEAVDWLAGYLRIDTSNPPGNEGRAASYLAAILHQEGISTQLLVTPRGRANLYARLEAEQPNSEGALLLLHHMDVVPPGEGWTADPWAAAIDRGRIWGRGAIDAKSLGISHLAAMVALRRSGVPLARDVVFLAVADEEAGGHEGAAWLLEHHADLFDDVAGVLNEGGSNRAAGDRLFWWGIEVAQKRPLWLKVSTRGRGGHGSTYNPMSASHQLVAALANLFQRPFEMRVTPAAHGYFRAIAPFHSEAFREVFASADIAEVAAEFQALFDEGRAGKVLLPGMSAFFQDTLQITSLETPSRTVNVVPAAAEALLDIRLLPDTPVDEAMASIREWIGKAARIEVLLSSEPTEPSPIDSEVYMALESVLADQAPLVPSFITGTTDSRYFRERGTPAYGFSPFVLTGDEVRGIHGADESIPLGKFRRGLDTMRRVVHTYAAAD
ncbi:MAG: M20/M25/M40 family metallo-hydrolase [Thermoanaerobaculia bacterium]|nr:M20/M25/M40 family metallo-hydrolase [Thermoanaerobaculia bacterium]